jgi:hypothetical protein
MQSIAEKTIAEQSSIKSVSNFFSEFGLGPALKSAGAYKQSGVAVAIVIKYLISLIYTGRSMYQDMRSTTPFAQGFCKDTVYRLLNTASINWQAFLLSVAGRVVLRIRTLTSEERRCAFVIDDTMFAILHAKKTELVSKVFDHAEKGKNRYKTGFRMLALGWTDGASYIPLTFRHLASADEKLQLCGMKPGLDKRSRAYRIRKEAVTKASEVMLMHLKAAIKAGIAANYVLFDSWFAYPATIIKVRDLGLHAVSRVKDTTKIKYLVNGERKTAKEIFRGNKKRRGKSRYLLSVPITLYAMDGKTEVTNPARLVYVRNRNKRNDWIALITTDMELSEEDVISTYGKRWDIEVFFKICKSYLKLTNEYQQLSYDALTARTTIVMIRYMMLSVERRTMQDPRTLGELFFLGFEEVADIRFEQALMLIMSLLSDTLSEDQLGLTEEQMQQIMDSFIEKLPIQIRNCLSPGFAA